MDRGIEIGIEEFEYENMDLIQLLRVCDPVAGCCDYDSVT
jgi:hypothetical protein